MNNLLLESLLEFTKAVNQELDKAGKGSDDE